MSWQPGRADDVVLVQMLGVRHEDPEELLFSFELKERPKKKLYPISLKAVRQDGFLLLCFFLFYSGLQVSGCGRITLGRAISFSKSINSMLTSPRNAS